MTPLVFFVPGDPVSKGSMSAFPMLRPCKQCRPGVPCHRRGCVGGRMMGATITDQHEAELKVWQGFIAVHARNARITEGWPVAPAGVAFELGLVFLLERPKAHYTSKGAISSDGAARPMPISKPDADKLARAVFDALTGVIYADDAQAPSTTIDKVWAPEPKKAGVVVTISRLEHTPDRVLSALRSVGMRVSQNVQGILV